MNSKASAPSLSVPADPQERKKFFVYEFYNVFKIPGEAEDFCSCCGGRSWSADFTFPTLDPIHPRMNGTREDTKKYVDLKYPEECRKRFQETWGRSFEPQITEYINSWMWCGKPGIHLFLGVDKKAAIDHLWKGSEYEKTADGYDIQDPDLGVACVVWSGQ